MRLIAAPGQAKPAYQAGVQIAVPSGSHTYWKQPGDAGVPPVFTFDASSNVKKAEVLYPVPSRISEDGLEALGYSAPVVFPLVVTPVDGAKPTKLHVNVAYAICNQICVPAHASQDIELPVPSDQASANAMATALARVPKPLPDADRQKLKILRVPGASKPTWSLTWTGTTPLRDIFADAPDGYTFDTKRVGQTNGWLLVEGTLAGNVGKPLPIALTLATGTGGFSVTESLDLSPPKP